MATTFPYLPILIGIRNDKFTHLITPRTITETSLQNVHLRVLKRLADLPYSCSLIFENELFLLRPLRNIYDNEIEDFVTGDETWDVLIVSPFNESTLQDVPNHTLIKKVTDTSRFYYDNIYIASSRFMQKVKSNNLSNIQTYVYSDPFLENMTGPSLNNKYSIGYVVNIELLGVDELRYKWKEFLV
jgi:hypothetical protein